MSMTFIKPDKRALVKRLIKMNALGVNFNGSSISMRFDRSDIKNLVKVKKHLGWVGHWEKHSNTILYDDDLLKHPKELICVLVHESIEKYVYEKYGLSPDAEGHYVASMIEQKFARTSGVNWNDYNWRVEFIYRKEMKHDKKKVLK
jgi:hypothetical protein